MTVKWSPVLIDITFSVNSSGLANSVAQISDWKPCVFRAVITHACNPSTWNSEDFWVRGQPGLQSEFQDSQDCTEKPCLETNKQTNKQTKTTTTTTTTKNLLFVENCRKLGTDILSSWVIPLTLTVLLKDNSKCLFYKWGILSFQKHNIIQKKTFNSFSFCASQC